MKCFNDECDDNSPHHNCRSLYSSSMCSGYMSGVIPIDPIISAFTDDDDILGDDAIDEPKPCTESPALPECPERIDNAFEGLDV